MRLYDELSGFYMVSELALYKSDGVRRLGITPRDVIAFLD